MNLFPSTEDDSLKKKVVVDFKYFIQSAIEKKIPWNVLTYFLTDLAPTVDKSKEVIARIREMGSKSGKGWYS